MQDPGDRQALGVTLARLRTTAGVTQETVARKCTVDRTTVAHIEAGRRSAPRAFWAAADAAVAASGALLAAYDAGRGFRHSAQTPAAGILTVGTVLPAVDLASMLDTDLERWLMLNRRQVMALLGVAGNLPAASLLAGLESDSAGHIAHAVNAKVDAAAIDQIETVLDAVGRQYEAFGPRAVLAVRQSQADLVDALLRDCPEQLLPRLLSVRASLARSLGWMSYDAGNLSLAAHHYELARDAAHQAGNPALSALVLCNMSLAATRGGKPGIGVDHAMAARYWANSSDDVYLAAYSADMAAEAHAELGQADQCRAALDQAREIIENAAAATHLPSYVYDPGLNAGFAAECLTKLGLGDQAVTAAHRCVDLFDPAYALSRGFADVGLGTALCLTGEVDEAVTIIARTADTAANYGSARLAGEVVTARNTLHHTAPDSAAVRTLDAALAARGLR
ncbi:helix-turn-helix domain-containing protein (plasmid) [Nocardia sp. CA-084685]|uniref:helix-turn-helix transcriptional regulator n=1 Tax=Nocardia sp. CA-084685 TaxID=3239970 RepID=UPI003D95A244